MHGNDGMQSLPSYYFLIYLTLYPTKKKKKKKKLTIPLLGSFKYKSFIPLLMYYFIFYQLQLVMYYFTFFIKLLKFKMEKKLIHNRL